MKKLIPVLFLFSAFPGLAQYDIKINFKGAKDSVFYLWQYSFDKFSPVDTCLKPKNGLVVFKGKKVLDKGVYCLISQEKSKYIDIFINECSKMTINVDFADILGTLKSPDCKEADEYFKYGYFFPKKNQEFESYRKQTKGKSKDDSLKFMMEKVKILNDDLVKYETDYMKSHAGTFIWDVLNLKTEKNAPLPLPKASNGRPDSVYSYYYYKSHFWDGVNFNDEKMLRSPYFADRFKRYFEKVIIQSPDTIIQEVDRILGKCKPGTDMSDFLIARWTLEFEQSKIMGYDRLFVHMIDTYIRTGKAKGVWDEATIDKIKGRGDILKPLLLGNTAPELIMIDTINSKKVLKMGFDTAKTGPGLQKVYDKNAGELVKLYTTLSSVNAKWTVLVFWDVDCSHCQQEIPKLLETYHKLKAKYDIKVYSVYTMHEYEKYRKWIIDHKLDFINVWDPIHINNVKDKYDIYSTPVIYLLDRNKKIKYKRLSEEQIPEIIQREEEMEKQQQKK